MTTGSASGLYKKFEVKRLHPSSRGIPHTDCEYFVIDATHDPLAGVALRAYADACETESPYLARSLRRLADKSGAT